MYKNISAILSTNLKLDVEAVRKYEREKRKRAWKNFAENVSIAGILELYQAAYSSVRWLWRITLLGALVSIVYHTSQLIYAFCQQGPGFQVIHTSTMIIPFPNVTPCVPAGINKTFALQNLKIPYQVHKTLAKLPRDKRQEFIDRAIQFVSYSMENMADLDFNPTSPLYREMHRVTTATTDEFPGGSQKFAHSSVARCEHTITECYFAGMRYNCCENSVLKLADGGPCFELPVSTHGHPERTLKAPI